MTTTRLADEPALSIPAVPSIPSEGRKVLERATVREILMGAQDNLTTVLAVMLGVSIGTGRADIVALAGLSASVAEAVSMGGVLYSSTRAEAILTVHLDGPDATRRAGLAPAASGFVTFVAALVAGLVPLTPFLFVPLPWAVVVSVLASAVALFILGSLIGRISGSSWWRDGLRLLIVAGLAAAGSAAVGAVLHIA